MKLLICILAAFRLANLIPDERGPFGIFDSFRIYVGNKANTGSKAWKEIAYVSNCPYCEGFWTSLLVSQIALERKSSMKARILTLFAVYGGQTLLQGVMDWLDSREE